MHKSIFTIGAFALAAVLLPLTGIAQDSPSPAHQLSGRILLQVEQNGEAWYMEPISEKRYFLGRPADAFTLMRELGLGITDADLARIPTDGTAWDGSTDLMNQVRGKILIQVEQNGEAWYVSPVNNRRYYMGRPSDAFALMRNLGLGISDSNLISILIHNDSAPLPGGSAAGTCAPQPEPKKDVIHVMHMGQMQRAMEEIRTGRSNVTVLIYEGTYVLDDVFWVEGDNVTFQGETGNRDDVKLFGAGGGSPNAWPSNIISAAGDNITVADMTIGRVGNHAVQVHGEEPYDADNFHMSNVRVIDTGEQMLKGSYNSSGSSGPDSGLVECSLFEYTSGIGPQWYVGGIDVHNGKDWIVKNNTFREIQSPEEALAEHAIHFWSGSSGTHVKYNVIINSDRAIGFGLGERGHGTGTIRDNKIYHDTSRGDVAIGLESAANVDVYRNTILHEHDYSRAIEYRFSDTSGGEIYDNTLSDGYTITSRDGGTAAVRNNKLDANISDYTDPANGDFSLK